MALAGGKVGAPCGSARIPGAASPEPNGDPPVNNTKIRPHHPVATTLAAATTFALALTSATCLAQDDPASTAGDPLEEPNLGALHFELGGEWTNAYFFRGILQEDDGFIFQNWIDLGVDLATHDNWSLGANFGIWNSMHEETDTAGSTDDFVEHLYETDLYAGLGLNVEAWTFSATYVLYTSPSDAFSTIGEIDLSVGFDDSELWGGDFALNPYVTLAIEVDDTASTEDTYLELGIAPGFSHEFGKTVVDFAFPVTAGFSVDDYYLDENGDEEAFGYLKAGVDASLPLPISRRYGTWTLGGGVHGLFLGDATEDINDGDDFEVIGRFGLTIGY